ncbi:MAG: hypothetical protein R2848_05870 [Thermomicrobiales bacterium]
MDLRFKRERVVRVVCALFFAAAIGIPVIGAAAASSVLPRFDRDDVILDTGNQHPCGEIEQSDSGGVRPGMRFMTS